MCTKWFTNGALPGYIKASAADAIPVPGLGGSLCGVLVGELGKHCTAAQIAHGGDYCSKTLMAGGCDDSFWLSATFAANAVKINPAGTPGNSPLCGMGK
jgi:hypothetical protein